MSDQDVAGWLRDLDAPRPPPAALRTDLEAQLSDAAVMAQAAAARAIPDDLRQRLEASLLDAPALPPRLDRRLSAALMRSRPAAMRPIAAAAAVVALVLVAGSLLFNSSNTADESVAAGPATTTPGSAPVGSPDAPAGPGTGARPGEAPPPFDGTALVEETPAAGSSGEHQPQAGTADSAGAQSMGRATELRVVVHGGSSVASDAFLAYLRALNESGGVNGRPVRTVGSGVGSEDAVVSVNLGATPVAGDGGTVPPWVRGALFETMNIDDARLRGAVTSLASPLESQARLAVREAFPERAVGQRAAVYVDAASPWVDRVGGAFEAALRAQGVTPLRVPFDREAPTLMSADAAFLALPTDSVAAWLNAASDSAPSASAWGVASAWDDALIADARAAGLQVLSPYAPATGEELRALRTALGHPLSAEAVHGWVTAKAIAFLLFDNGGALIDEESLNALVGWRSAWSPAFETRAGTRARTPEAVHLMASSDGFRATGPFRRDRF